MAEVQMQMEGYWYGGGGTVGFPAGLKGANIE